MKIYKFKITEKDIKDLRDILDASAYYEPQDHMPDYWEKIELFKDLFKEDIFEEDCI